MVFIKVDRPPRKIFPVTYNSQLLDNIFLLFFSSESIDPKDDAGAQTVLHIESLGHALHTFINGQLAGRSKLMQ